MVCATEDAGRMTAALCERTDVLQRAAMLWTRSATRSSAALDSMTLAELAGPRPRHPFHALPVHRSALQPVAERHVPSRSPWSHA